MFSNKTVGLDQGRSLHEVIPRIDELLADPAAYLVQEEVRIRRDPVSWLWFVIPSIMVALTVPAALQTRTWDAEAWLALVLWMVAVCLVYEVVGYWAWPVRVEIILSASGIAIHHGRRTIRAGWALFATTGAAVAGSVNFGNGKVITVPVNPAAVPDVELFLDDQSVATGRDVQSRVFRVFSEGEIQLTNWFEVNPTELGTLFLMLGNAIARPEDVTAPVDTAIQAARSADAITAVPGASSPAAALPGVGARWQAVGIDRAGWLRVPLTRLVFPRICCNCCRPTGNVQSYPMSPVAPGWFGLLTRFTNVRDMLHLQIPWCGACFHQHCQSSRAGGFYGALGGGALGLILGVLIGEPILQFSIALMGGVAGMLLGAFVGDRPPFEAKHLVKEQKVAFRFANPAFAHELMEAVQKSVES